MQLNIDKREGVHNLNIRVPDADEIVTLNWLSKLNGQQHTLISLERDDGWQVMVGGGPIYYIVTLGNADENLTLENSSGDEAKMVELCAGGQYGEYPESFCVDREQAANAVSLFFQGQEQQVGWQK
ncbi:hypothetical protein [Rhizobium sp. L245/93]|uniref:hypothetical protein n=1 Tax=Rhizobium sp. L245/93 TaxID=2819998 RepID=UPI001ADCD75B|nr:hypothetical protein [Rhizobium sp. L245/93]MBO9166777.1 hypothetical protein [Rhizobium sp. L245/93]